MTVATTTGGSNMTGGLRTIIDLVITTGLLADTDE
jgi:hypothetical protein